MNEVTLKLETGAFGRSAAGLVYGNISLVIDGVGFPDPSWSDFVVVVIAWWCEALSRVLSGEKQPIEVRFMDGPYLVELAAREEGVVQLVLVEVGRTRQVRRHVAAPLRPLVVSTLEAADQTLAKCREQGWWSRDADELAQGANSLRHHARSILSQH